MAISAAVDRILDAVAPEVAGIRRFGSAALDLAWVAAGRFDGFWEEDLEHLGHRRRACCWSAKRAASSPIIAAARTGIVRTARISRANDELHSGCTSSLAGALR